MNIATLTALPTIEPHGAIIKASYNQGGSLPKHVVNINGQFAEVGPKDLPSTITLLVPAFAHQSFRWVLMVEVSEVIGSFRSTSNVKLFGTSSIRFRFSGLSGSGLFFAPEK